MNRNDATEIAYKNGYEAGRPKWHRVEDMLPELPIDNQGYLCRCVLADNPLSFYMVLRFEKYSENPHFDFESSEQHEGLHVTHWMPLPDTPEDE